MRPLSAGSGRTNQSRPRWGWLGLAGARSEHKDQVRAALRTWRGHLRVTGIAKRAVTVSVHLPVLTVTYGRSWNSVAGISWSLYEAAPSLPCLSLPTALYSSPSVTFYLLRACSLSVCGLPSEGHSLAAQSL